MRPATFGMQLGFAKGQHKIPLRRKRGGGPELGKLHKIWGFHFNIFAMAGVAMTLPKKRY